MANWLTGLVPLASSRGSGPIPAPAADDLPASSRPNENQALDRLCREHWLPVYRAVCRLARTPSEAEDLTQEVFVRAIRAVGSNPDGRVPGRSYLLRIAHNLVIDKWRKRSPGTGPDDGLYDFADPTLGPEETVIVRDEHRRLLAALDRLPNAYSDVLRLRILEGRSAVQVGELLGQTANAVRQLQYRALAALRKEMAGETGETR
jgi:RNA polymerase sigma-70 factor (ECF subfamily)